MVRTKLTLPNYPLIRNIQVITAEVFVVREQTLGDAVTARCACAGRHGADDLVSVALASCHVTVKTSH